ncbi:hypothetical protein MJO29_005424 [Puccinia striiformis f. sp. tritici]|uniref:Uncharacterized protein n=4 Tax=Puccinia striiformis TaxID=27350 RepID=A0A0L0USZ7_9BASI|nr:hypothetical protein MJO29_005424 [Puccinia striiformis f. sp. tritici]KNE89874.1 hypothetical protein PSTG_16660 [Puccinia striiformis f. sp. tritici PST-78]
MACSDPLIHVLPHPTCAHFISIKHPINCIKIISGDIRPQPSAMHFSIWLMFFVVSLIHHAQGEDKPKPFPISGCDDEAKSTVLCVRAVFPDDKLTTREGAMVAPAPKITGHARRTCNGFEITAHTADRAYCCPKEFADPFTKPSPAFEFILKEKCKPVRMDWPKEKPIQ